MALLRGFLVFVCTILPSYGTKISFVIDSTCGDNNSSSQSSIVVQSSPVNLTCCVEDFLCTSWTISWYRNDSSDQISDQPTLTVDLTEPREAFECVANSDSFDPFCRGNPENQDVVQDVVLIRGNCFTKALVGFIEVPANDSYALIGCNKTLSFQFNFTGNHVTTFILVNNKSHLIKDLSIRHTKHHHINLEQCIEDFNLTLLTVNHMYSNNYTLYLSTSDNFNRSDLQYSFYLRVCDKPEWYRNQSYGIKDPTTHTATLYITFKACYSPHNDLIRAHWTKNGKAINISDKHYNVSHKHNHTLSLYTYTCVLLIYNTTGNDSGNYSCFVRYKQSKINHNVVENGTHHLSISSSASSKSDDNNWQLLGGLIGGGVFFLIILAGLIICFRSYRKPDHILAIDDPARPLIHQEFGLASNENSEPVFVPQQPVDSSIGFDESAEELPNMSPQVQLLTQSRIRRPAPSLKPRTKVEQRLAYYRKDIVEFLVCRERPNVFAAFKQRNMLRKDELNHFLQLDDQLQAYNYLVDAVLASGHVMAEKFHSYLIDTDTTGHFYELVAPKVFLFYMMTTGELEDNIQLLAYLLTECGINVICDFQEPGIGDSANFDGHLWVHQKINDCISSGGYVLVDVTSGPMNDLSHTHGENPKTNMRYTHFDCKTLYQKVINSRECFIPICLDIPPPNKVFPFDKSSVYRIDITDFQQKFLEFKMTKYLDEFNVTEREAMKGFINEAPDQFKPLVDLIRHLTSRQCYIAD